MDYTFRNMSFWLYFLDIIFIYLNVYIKESIDIDQTLYTSPTCLRVVLWRLQWVTIATISNYIITFINSIECYNSSEL